MYILERFEGNTAIIENDEDTLEVGRERIASGVREGDVLTEKDGKFYPDKEATETRRKKILELQNSLWA